MTFDAFFMKKFGMTVFFCIFAAWTSTVEVMGKGVNESRLAERFTYNDIMRTRDCYPDHTNWGVPRKTFAFIVIYYNKYLVMSEKSRNFAS